MQLCGSLLVLCPVHFVGLLEDQIRWQIWDCDSSGHTSLTTVRQAFEKIYAEDPLQGASLYLRQH